MRPLSRSDFLVTQAFAFTFSLYRYVSDNKFGGAAIYWVHDQPLMDYIGCKPNVKKFEPTLYKKADLLARVEEIKHMPTEDGAEAGGCTSRILQLIRGCKRQLRGFNPRCSSL